MNISNKEPIFFTKTNINIEDINNLFVSKIRKILENKNITIKQLSKLMYADKDTLDTNFKLQRGITYTKASVMYSILVNNKYFDCFDDIAAYEQQVIDKFYDDFIGAFERNNLTYLLAEEKYEVSHSTLFCYKNRKKKPNLQNAVVLSTLMKFDLSFDFFQFVLGNKV